MTQIPAQPIPTQASPVQQQVNEALAGGIQQPNLSFNQQTAPNICPNCRNIILPNFKFCPNCGKQFGSADVSVGRQIYVYAMSIGLPPIGLYFGIKYLLSPSNKNKIVGLVAATLTIISLVITIQLGSKIFQQIQQEIGVYQNISTGNLQNANPAQLQLLK